MRLIELTSIEKRRIAVCVNEIVSIERGDYMSSYGLNGCPTIINLTNGKYTVREDFDMVCDLIKGVDDDL
jgi:hypothetical protein